MSGENLKSLTKAVIVSAAAIIGGGTAYYLLRPVVIAYDDTFGMVCNKISGALEFVNNDSHSRRFWVLGQDIEAQQATINVQSVNGSLTVEMNQSYGTYYAVPHGSKVTIVSSSSGIKTAPQKIINATSGSPFARIDGQDLNFWLHPGSSAVLYGGKIGLRSITLTSVRGWTRL